MVASGRLHLAPPDTNVKAGAVGGAVRDLVGWLEPAHPDASWSDRVRSRDPALPGAVVVGDHLQLGDIGYYDGHVVHFHITAVAPEGFWGWWKADTGFDLTTDTEGRRILPDPAGYFCALRVPP